MSASEELQKALADTVSLYYRAQGAHWNVEGADFQEYHSLFGAIYEDLGDSIDPLAENIRKLGDYAPFKLQTFISLRSIDDAKVSPMSSSLAVDLLDSLKKYVDVLDSAFKAAQAENEQGLMNFLADRLDMTKKWIWQLSASTK